MYEKSVTVIVAVYNVENYLDKCIDSICKQSYKNMEIILVNDGSTDRSTEICDNWCKKDKRIRVVHKENGGVSTTRNIGLRKANGELVVFVDGDDWLEREAVSILVSNYEEGILITGGYYIDNQQETQLVVKERNSKPVVGGKETVVSLFEKGLFSSIWNKIYDLNIIRDNNILFNENMNLGEDILFNLSYLSYTKGKIRNVDKMLYHYVRRNIESLDNKYCEGFEKIQKEIYESFFKYLGEDMQKSSDWGKIQLLYFNALIVAIDNIYVNRYRFTRKQYKAIMNKRIFNEDIEALLNTMYGRYKVLCRLRYFFISHHMYLMDYYVRELVKKIVT